MTGCSTAPFTTVTILDTPSAFVRLETDRNVDRDDAQHTHPVTFTVEQMAGILGGIMIEEPFARMPLYEDTRQPRRHPALTEKEVAFFAPLLALALAKATPEEIVTFYQTRDLSGTSREVTSGGLFVQGEEVHILLANYRSSTYFVADVGVAGTTDDRLTPLRPLAPQRVVLDFEPRSAKREAPVSIWDKLMQKDRRDLVVFFSLVPPRPLHQPPSAPPAR
jgi:hypothetical protein